MIHDKIRTNDQFNKISSEFLTPSSALSYIGYQNDISGKVSLKVNDGERVQSTCNDSVVVPLTVAGSVINLNYHLGDIFFINSINSGNYTITVSHLGGSELRGKTILLYLNNVPANTTFSFGNSEILNVNEANNYCITFCNLKGTNVITCLSVFETPGLSAQVVTPPPSDPLTFKGRAASNAICLSAIGNPDPITLDYCMNNDDNWIPYTLGTVIEFNQKETVSFSGYNNHFSKSDNDHYRFQMTGTIEASGNIQSLLNFSDITYQVAFDQLFVSCVSLVDASKLQLSASKLANYCYNFMFSNCRYLSAAPALPATSLAVACYNGMFNRCLALSTAPALPASTLADGCYAHMFINCSSLQSAPALPANTLAKWCYTAMFANCTSLTSAPLLPATTLAPSCYYQMFADCINLTSINVSFTDWTDTATQDWVSGVAANGTFTCPAALDTTTKDASHVPQNWNVVNPQ